ncbi:Asp23/Gls24 family envelope stress response protein [Kibdelosporangium phytohabitans]|uniref:Stress protein, Gls24 family n=1 Tax=Kibdelosporangium phytohabitans TaxID=860235 RepID=A0A0N9HWY6_9PSEU|nr:Asp23/Gls24 family envelope stress response protein [Kibdelosporangium phytohabitans]ALG09955.1 stress protein, Gls24 family [Kibdelosporangium phytohabitans]MBE1468633.1 putative alkaline shock family protein YloU [Kibdelosporangium phytohabitans]
MTNPAVQKTDATKQTSDGAIGKAVQRRSGGLVTAEGTTTIADVVVQKIAGLATREIAGVHSLGGGTARVLSAIRDRIPGASASAGQGVTVEVGETQAAVDLEVVVEYGVSINDLAKAVRHNVTTAIEQIIGLQVVEVNINVNDIHLPGDDDNEPEISRVQ